MDKERKETNTVSYQNPFLVNIGFIHRNFALLWLGQAISQVGDFVFDTTLILWVTTRLANGQTWAPLAVSGIILASSVPTFLFSLPAGVFVDRWDKRRTMLWTDGLRALLILLLVIIASLNISVGAGNFFTFFQLGAIYAVVILVTTCTRFFNPARLALLGDIVEDVDRPKAVGLTEVTLNIAIVIGPPLAAVLFFSLGVYGALIANAASFVVSFLTILAIHTPQSASSVAPSRRGHVFGELKEGFSFFVHSQVLMAILISGCLVLLGGGAVNTLDYFFVTENLHAPASFYGLVGGIFGIGAVIGALLASRYAQRIGLARMLSYSTLLLGLLIVLFGRLTQLIPGLVVMFLIGLLNVATTIASRPLLLRYTPKELVGRVASVINLAFSLAGLLSATLAGYLVSFVLPQFHSVVLGMAFGPVDTVYTAAGFLIVIGGLYAMIVLRSVQKEKKDS